MRRRTNTLHLVFILISLSGVTGVSAQRYLTEYDSSFFLRDTVRPVVKRFENIHFSGYIQPQFQVIQSKGAQTYAGGNFLPYADNRFMLRRARIKLDYKMPGKSESFPAALFTFQFEATERDVNVRDMFIRIYEPKDNNFSLSAGLFGRPFGYEVNLSSSYRETPERGRMSQILMPSERDLGVMISYESQSPQRKDPLFKFDIGMFNGQGKSGPAEFDSYKDFISRVYLKPMRLNKHLFLSGGLSFLKGGWVNPTKYRYEMGSQNGTKVFVVDSSEENVGGKATKDYYGADIQLAQKTKAGKVEIRGEYWKGKQSGTGVSLVNPGTLPVSPLYIRNFDGGFIYFLTNVFNTRWELMGKYDWFDPNTSVEEREMGKSGTNFTGADVRFNTYGFGFTHYFTNNLRVLAYYDLVTNEITDLPGYNTDLKDNVLTIRMQLRF